MKDDLSNPLSDAYGREAMAISKAIKTFHSHESRQEQLRLLAERLDDLDQKASLAQDVEPTEQEARIALLRATRNIAVITSNTSIVASHADRIASAVSVIRYCALAVTAMALIAFAFFVWPAFSAWLSAIL